MPLAYPPGTGPAIQGVAIYDVKATFGGEHVMVAYTAAYLSAEGQTMGLVRSNIVSPESKRLLAVAVESMERDFLENSILQVQEPDEPPPGAPGLTYPAPDSTGR